MWGSCALGLMVAGILNVIWPGNLSAENSSVGYQPDDLAACVGACFGDPARAARYGSFELHAGNPEIQLVQFGLRENEWFSYVYDMGDHWEHEIRLEAINPPPKKTYPICTGGSGACPPEDCGGPHGYQERRDQADGYDAWRDMCVMSDFLEDIVAADAPERKVSDFLNDDVEDAMERIKARQSFLEGKFSRGDVNKRFRAGDHRDLMRQQMW